MNGDAPLLFTELWRSIDVTRNGKGVVVNFPCRQSDRAPRGPEFALGPERSDPGKTIAEAKRCGRGECPVR